MYPNGICPNCGGRLFGDGCITVLHCEFADEDEFLLAEPDAQPVFCRPEEKGVSLGVRKAGPLIWKVMWDIKGHWITSKNGNKNHLWLWFGPTRSEDGLTIYNLTIGPLGIAIGWSGQHTST